LSPEDRQKQADIALSHGKLNRLGRHFLSQSGQLDGLRKAHRTNRRARLKPARYKIRGSRLGSLSQVRHTSRCE